MVDYRFLLNSICQNVCMCVRAHRGSVFVTGNEERIKAASLERQEQGRKSSGGERWTEAS